MYKEAWKKIFLNYKLKKTNQSKESPPFIFFPTLKEQEVNVPPLVVEPIHQQS